MWHLLIEITVAAALFALGFIIGGSVAWYRGWDEGFREGYRVEVSEKAKGLRASPPSS
jgi:hypothetical protein